MRDARPANYVMWKIDNDYVVFKRDEPKGIYLNYEHFVGFYSTEKSAYLDAIERLESKVSDLMSKIKKLKRKGMNNGF